MRSNYRHSSMRKYRRSRFVSGKLHAWGGKAISKYGYRTATRRSLLHKISKKFKR